MSEQKDPRKRRFKASVTGALLGTTLLHQYHPGPIFWDYIAPGEAEHFLDAEGWTRRTVPQHFIDRIDRILIEWAQDVPKEEIEHKLFLVAADMYQLWKESQGEPGHVEEQDYLDVVLGSVAAIREYEVPHDESRTKLKAGIKSIRDIHYQGGALFPPDRPLGRG